MGFPQSVLVYRARYAFMGFPSLPLRYLDPDTFLLKSDTLNSKSKPIFIFCTEMCKKCASRQRTRQRTNMHQNSYIYRNPYLIRETLNNSLMCSLPARHTEN